MLMSFDMLLGYWVKALKGVISFFWALVTHLEDGDNNNYLVGIF